MLPASGRAWSPSSRLADRTPAELVDYRRLEAAINVVFAKADVDLLCPYDAGSLPAHLLEIGQHTHDAVRVDGVLTPNPRYDDPFDVLAGLSAVVPPPPGATSIDCASPADVAGARRLVRSRGAEAGLDPDVVADVALAVTEVLTNALLHGAPPALLHVYQESATWVCHVHDGGRGPMDPLIGLVPPAQPSDHGYGLWLARQLCAAVDIGNDRSGTHVRLHTRTSASRADGSCGQAGPDETSGSRTRTTVVARLGLHADLAPVPLDDDPPGDVEPETRALADLLGREERLEGVGRDLLGHARARCRRSRRRRGARRRTRRSQGAGAVHGVDGVVDEVRPDLVELAGVGVDGGTESS